MDKTKEQFQGWCSGTTLPDLQADADQEPMSSRFGLPSLFALTTGFAVLLAILPPQALIVIGTVVLFGCAALLPVLLMRMIVFPEERKGWSRMLLFGLVAILVAAVVGIPHL